jgi:hypothetical protein
VIYCVQYQVLLIEVGCFLSIKSDSELRSILSIPTISAMRGLSNDHDNDFLADTFLRTVWLFQLLVTSPVAIALGVSSLVRLLEVHGPIYDFIASLCTSIFAAGIVFILIVQRKTFENGVSLSLTVKFEALKSALATILWIWCMVDAAVQPTSDWNRRTPRMIAASCSSILLL